MKIKSVKTHEIKFDIVEYEEVEGGMRVHTYAEGLNTIEEALNALESARYKDSKCNWIIVLDVNTTIGNN